MRIVRATSPEQVAVARALVADYFRSWGVEDVSTEPELAEELEQLGTRYVPPDGALLYAETDGGPAGVVALRRLDDEACEMKRMFVRPAFRRSGIGRALAVAIMLEGSALGFRRMVLDTPSDNGRALAMYRSIGFTDIEPYVDPDHDHVHDNWVFLGSALPVDADRRADLAASAPTMPD